MKFYAPTPPPGKDIHVRTPGFSFDEAVNWITVHSGQIGVVLACLIVAGVIRSVWKNVPKSALIFIVIVGLVIAGVLQFKKPA